MIFLATRLALTVPIAVLAACASTRASHVKPVATPATGTAASVQPTEKPAPIVREPNPCELLKLPEDGAIDRTRLLLARTMCSAANWFDGLFGDYRRRTRASRGFGNLELFVTHSESERTKGGGRLNARVPFPNLEKKLHIFIAREDQRNFIRDRIEGMALRSQFLHVDTDERWVGGVGYALSESEAQSTSFRVGVHGSTAPEVFAQGIYRREVPLSSRSRGYFRQTVFWTNREHLGTTTNLAADRVLTSRLMARADLAATISQTIQGVDWRTSFILYQSLAHRQAIAGQVFARGETGAPVHLGEYGLNAIYRRPIGSRDWLFGEGVVGYSWPRKWPDRPREGSLLAGIGIEMAFEF